MFHWTHVIFVRLLGFQSRRCQTVIIYILACMYVYIINPARVSPTATPINHRCFNNYHPIADKRSACASEKLQRGPNFSAREVAESRNSWKEAYVRLSSFSGSRSQDCWPVDTNCTVLSTLFGLSQTDAHVLRGDYRSRSLKKPNCARQ